MSSPSTTNVLSTRAGLRLACGFACRLASWLACCFALCLAWVGCRAEPAAEPPAKRLAAAPTMQEPVLAEAVHAPPSEPVLEAPERSLEGPLQLAGDLRPERAADLAFKIGGQLATVKAVRGERVKKGQLLATLSEVEARAQLAQAQGAVAQAQAQVALAQDAEERAASLSAAKAAPGSQVVTTRLQLSAAKAGLLSAQAAVDLAAAALANHQLKAPFDGELVRVPDGIGQIVAAGVPLFRIEQLDQLTLRATVGEADLDRIHVGDELTVTTASGALVAGKVNVVLRSLEAQSRRAPIEASVPNANRALVAGSYVRVSLAPKAR